MKFILLGFVVLHSFVVLGESHSDMNYQAVFKCIPESHRVDLSKPYAIVIYNPVLNVDRIVLVSDSSERGCHLNFSLNNEGYSGILIKYFRISYPFGYLSGLPADLTCDTDRELFRTPINLASSAPRELLEFCFEGNHVP